MDAAAEGAIEIPTALRDRLAARQVVLVAGLRCSELMGAPAWEALGKRLVDWIEDEAARAPIAARLEAGAAALASTIALLGARVPREALVEVIKDAYPRAATPEVIAAAAAVPWRGVVTTGFDGSWATAGATRVAPGDGVDLATHGRFVLELAGGVDAPDRVIVGAGDARARLGATDVAAQLRALARRRSFVLVGFAPGDPDLALVTAALAGEGGPHFWFAPASGLDAEALGAEVGATIVPCAAGRAGVEASLRALVDAWGGLASDARPADDDVAAWLEIWRRDPSDEAPRAALVRAEASLRADARWEELIELLLGRVEVVTSVDEQVASLREVARLYAEKIGLPDGAFTALEAAFRRAPASDDLRAELERAAGEAGQWRELASDYAEMATAAAGATAASSAPIRLALARVFAEELDRPSDAVAAYEEVLALEPKNAAAATAVVDLLARQERWSELAPALSRAAELAEDAGALRLRLADVQASRLDDVSAALATYEGVLGDERHGAEALDAMERLARRAERWSDLARALERKIERSKDAAATARARRERATVLEAHLDDVPGALRELEAALAADPADRAALRAADALYERVGRDADHLRALERLADLAESDAEKLLLLRRLAAEWEERRAAPADGERTGYDRAADALEQILHLAPDDADAFAALARVYRQARRFVALAEAVARRREISADRAERRALAVELARLNEEELADPARAAELYAEAETLGDEGEATAGALARLHENAGRWAEAAEALERVARVAREPAARVDALVRAAAIARDQVNDRATAEARYARALEIDAGHVPSLVALAALYRAGGEHIRAAKLMREAEARTQNRLEKARLLYELGVVYEDELDDDAQATEALARALDVDPEHVGAAERLAALYERAERWAPLEPVLDLLVRKAPTAAPDSDEAAALAHLHARLGEAARRLGNLDKAVRAFEAALALAPGAFDVLRAFGEVREVRKEWSDAADLFARALASAPELAPATGAALLARLGAARAHAGDRAAALASYAEALEIEPKNRAVVEAVAALHAEAGDHAALRADKRALIALAPDDEARATLLDEIGDLEAEKLNDHGAAVRAYEEALALVPGRRQTLHKLLELHTADGAWLDAASTTERLAEAESQPAVRAKYRYAAAVIRRDELEDLPGAVTLFNSALDDAPDLTKAFDAIERLLSEVGAWKELARNYRRMIKRLPAEGLSDLRLRLWSGLGEVSLTEIEDPEMAATALEVAASLDPDNVERHERLADVYVTAGPSHHEKAIAEHQWLIARNPDRLASYQALASLYAAVGAHDKLWCVASTLSFLGKAEPPLRELYEARRPRELRAARRPFDDDAWLKVLHPAEDRFIDAIFMLVGPHVAAATAQQHQAVGLRRKDRVDVTADARVPSRALRYLAQTLELAPPDFFFKETEPGSLVLVNLQERGVLTPALVVGRGIEQRSSESELVFEMAKAMAFLRPERFVRAAVPQASTLEVALRAALAVGGAAPAGGEVERFAADLARVVPKPIVEQVAGVARRLVASRGDALDVPGWMAAVDLTAARVGFAITGDVAGAARVITSEALASSAASKERRLADLLAFSVSEDYFAVRDFLGLSVY
ncbi:MAG TPA: tetratricopeptide repeat protein [Polyangia bacterium]|nr:tetratricopeptide repeat protein [Polyangia bacterium]